MSMTERGFKQNGLTFTGTYVNGRLLVIADAMPVKTRKGELVHVLYLPDERDPLTGELLQTIACSQKFYDDLMTDAEVEKNKVESLSQR